MSQSARQVATDRDALRLTLPEVEKLIELMCGAKRLRAYREDPWKTIAGNGGRAPVGIERDPTIVSKAVAAVKELLVRLIGQISETR
jgi:hypothetical protein